MTNLILIIPLILKSQDYCSFIQNIQNYQDSVKLKSFENYYIIDSNTFDINLYLSYFDNIKFEDGWMIDVYFFDNFLDGKPYLYATKELHNFNTRNSLYKFLNEPASRAKNHAIPMDSEKGFLQYLFFSELGEQFALKWHEYYNEKYIICSEKKLYEIVNGFRNCNQAENDEGEMVLPLFSVDSQELNEFAQINPTIKIELTNEYCTITWIENRTHSGIYRCKYKIQRQIPYEIERINEEQLLKISIGFDY